jgi:hypothetical protein
MATLSTRGALAQDTAADLTKFRNHEEWHYATNWRAVS